MAELSRKKKFQELRDRLDEETTVTQVESVSTYIGPYGKITRQGAHAAKPIHSYQKEEAAPQPSAVAKSEVMSDLLGEVKQYNIDNGNRMEDDTQINILRTLESSSEQKRRNKHFVPMEEEEKMGSTMRIERGLKKEQPKEEAALPKTGRLTRINPINALPSFKKEEEEEVKKTSENPIVLNQNDIRADYPAETDDLDILGFGQEKPAVKEEVKEEEVKKPKKSHSFFKRKPKKEVQPVTKSDDSKENTAIVQDEILDIETPSEEVIAEEEEILPVKKSRKQESAAEQDKDETPAMNSQNIIIIVLIVLLLLSIALSFFILSRMNIF